MSVNFLRGASNCALVAALVLGAGAAAQAQNEEQNPVIQIGEADEGVAISNLQEGQEDFEQPALPKYWIGLAGSAIPADHVLRAHLDLPENVGLLVARVEPNSPAAKAGVKQHDILLRANDVDLHEMRNLVDLVATEGAKKGQVAVEVFRRGQRETFYITPADRPANVGRPQLGQGGGFGDGFLGEGGVPPQVFEQFRHRLPMEFRNFGPGVIVGGGEGTVNIPKGVQINISRDGDKPPRVTVKRGDETWEIDGADPESLSQLPEDLRPAVEQMLRGASPMELHMRDLGRNIPEFGEGRLQDRLERMERRMEELTKRLQENRKAVERDSNTDDSK